MKGLLSGDDGEEMSGLSVMAVVATAFAMAPDDPDETLPKPGSLPARELVEPREAREPGRNGEARTPACCGVVEVCWCEGESVGDEGTTGEIGGIEVGGDWPRLDVASAASAACS